MKKFLISIFIALIISSSILPTISYAYGYSEEIPITEEYTYYSYKAEKEIFEALNNYPGLSEMQKIEIMRILEVNGYFLLKTREEKKKFLNRYFRNTPYINIIALVEKENGWNIPPPDVSQVSSTESKKVQDALSPKAKESFQSWSEIRNRIIQRCGTGVNRDPGADNFRYPPSPQFGRKACWSGAELEKFYSEHPEWKANLQRSQFTEQELKYLGILEFRLSAVGGQAIGKGVFGGEAWEDLIIFIPVEKGVIWVLRKVGGKVVPIIFRPVIDYADKLAGGAIRRAAVEAGEMLYKIRIFSKGRKIFDFDLELDKIFARTTFTRRERLGWAEMLRDTLQRMLDDPYFGPEVIGNPMGFQNSLKQLRFQRLIRKAGYYDVRSGVRISEFYTRFNLNAGQDIWVHELFHSVSSVSNNYYNVRMYYSAKIKSYPLLEGFVEKFMRDFIVRSSGRTSFANIAYHNESRVAGEVILALQRRLGVAAGREKAQELLFRGALKDLDSIFGSGTHDYIHCLMDAGRYDKAINFIRGL